MKKINWPLFLIGVGSMTQISLVGQLGISELFVFLAAPIFFLQDMGQLKKDGFMPIIWLAILTCVSTVISSVLNHTPFTLFLRGFACNYSIFAGVVVLHRYVRKDLVGVKWFLLGSAISIIINIFAFRTGSDLYKLSMGGGDDVDVLMSNSVFWIGKLAPWLSLPITGWYFQTPIGYSCLEPILFSIYCLLTSVSGRSSALVSLGSVILIYLGRKNIGKMRSIGKNFLWLAFLGMLMLWGVKSLYQITATNGMLGEKAQEKYERQTQGKKGVLALLMGGRMEFFVGLAAAIRAPLWGYGPWPKDRDGIYNEFLAKYGNYEDYVNRAKAIESAKRAGRWMGQGGIPAHSHIVGAWVYYGFIGFVMWLYYLYRMLKLVRYDLASVPCWFGYFAVMLPSTLWHVLFSPFAGRMERAMLIVCMLLAECVRRGRLHLPLECLPPVR